MSLLLFDSGSMPLHRMPLGNALEENGSVNLRSAKGAACTVVPIRNCFALRSVLREFLRSTLLWILHGIAAALPLFAQASPDPFFSTIPFDRWLAERAEAQIRWTTRIPAVELSIQQRL